MMTSLCVASRRPMTRTIYLVLLLCVCSHVCTHGWLSFINADKEDTFSGMYFPDVQKALETYAGSWLAPTKRFLAAEKKFRSAKALEFASFAILDTGPTVMTRDYFDFSVVHLSSTTNQKPVKDNSAFYPGIRRRLKGTIETLRKTRRTVQADARIREQTLAIIPFSTFSASLDLDGEKFQAEVRSLFFEATFWSVYRFCPNVVVSVGTLETLKLVNKMRLPAFKYLNFTANFNSSAHARDLDGGRHHLPRYTLNYVHERIRDRDEEWSRFKYVYYTEGDHLLNMRHSDRLMDTLDAMDYLDTSIAIAPHRLQSQVLPAAFPKLQHQFARDGKYEDLSVRLITENGTLPVGSCCDDGRFRFADCKNWWYNCPSWGIRNYTTWVRFGKSGLPFPAGSEHQARCSYSPTKRLCEVPVGCVRHERPTKVEDVCGEIPKVEYTFASQENEEKNAA